MPATTTTAPEGSYLGPLCKRGHDHEGTGQSLRMRTGHCHECKLLTNRRADKNRRSWRRGSPEYKAYQRRYQNAYGQAKRKEDPKWARDVDRKQNERNKQRRRTDGRYLIKMRLRSRLNNALRLYAKGGKVCTADEYGIDYQTIIDHLGPCPGPREDWHIDHIRPLVSFDLDDHDQVREAFAPTNHQWLPAAENMSKQARISG